MTGDQIAAAGVSAGGQSRLAAVMATRGGLAAPEAPFVIEHREALIYMLCEAAELEHGIMCQYLFAAFSLKQAADEGLSDGGDRDTCETGHGLILMCSVGVGSAPRRTMDLV
jgi:Ferritin-like